MSPSLALVHLLLRTQQRPFPILLGFEIHSLSQTLHFMQLGPGRPRPCKIHFYFCPEVLLLHSPSARSPSPAERRSSAPAAGLRSGPVADGGRGAAPEPVLPEPAPRARAAAGGARGPAAPARFPSSREGPARSPSAAASQSSRSSPGPPHRAQGAQLSSNQPLDLLHSPFQKKEILNKIESVPVASKKKQI